VTRFVFLDRDGTLVHDPGYVHRVEDYALLPGVGEGLARLASAGFSFAVATNQSGIARGKFTEQHFARFQARLDADLARFGVKIAAHLFCPHHPDAGCACRKPKPGMLFEARDRFRADLGASFMIGNHRSDALAAIAAGCRGAVLIGSRLTAATDLPERTAWAPDFPAAVEAILARDLSA
jgi:D-glycero-D-manno-heptose 1,7-bisphosphate phosphatase